MTYDYKVRFFLQSRHQNNECLNFRSLAVDNQFCSSLSSCGARAQQFVRSFQYFLLKVQICQQGPKVTKKKHLILVRYLMSCQQKQQEKNLRGCGISLTFSFLAEMRLRDNSKSNIYWQLVDGLQRPQFKTFAGFFSSTDSMRLQQKRCYFPLLF